MHNSAFHQTSNAIAQAVLAEVKDDFFNNLADAKTKVINAIASNIPPLEKESEKATPPPKDTANSSMNDIFQLDILYLLKEIKTNIKSKKRSASDGSTNAKKRKDSEEASH